MKLNFTQFAFFFLLEVRITSFISKEGSYLSC